MTDDNLILPARRYFVQATHGQSQIMFALERPASSTIESVTREVIKMLGAGPQIIADLDVPDDAVVVVNLPKDATFSVITDAQRERLTREAHLRQAQMQAAQSPLMVPRHNGGRR